MQALEHLVMALGEKKVHLISDLMKYVTELMKYDMLNVYLKFIRNV